MNLKKRLQALERLAVPPDDDRCEACGYDRTAPARLSLSFAEAPVDGPDACPKCGRQLLIRISIMQDTGRRSRSELV